VTAGRRELSGTVTAITYPGLGSSPVLRMSMRTGDGTVTLAFLGRRDIHCIEVGSSLRVRGILAGRRGAAILSNPDYTATPRGGGGEYFCVVCDLSAAREALGSAPTCCCGERKGRLNPNGTDFLGRE